MRKFLEHPAWVGHARIVHGFGTAFAGAAGLDAADEAAREAAKRRTLRAAIDEALALAGEGFARALTVKQVHGTDLLVLDREVAVPISDTLALDGMLTDRPGVLIGVKTADCLPVLIAERDGRAVAAAHGGWRGLLAGIVEKTAAALGREFGCRPERLQVALGPSARGCCYEVSPELAEQFKLAYGPSVLREGQGKPHLDLAAVAAEAARRAGVPAENIADVGACTICSESPRFYSWRRDGQKTGRLFSYIGLRPTGKT
ncbi:MAG: peptidoglycan editing factor PgeF [Myxococcales bacterium]|nr:MAG: peptidoglycan editing factor PgeF [Myxococcales bacterium]